MTTTLRSSPLGGRLRAALVLALLFSPSCAPARDPSGASHGGRAPVDAGTRPAAPARPAITDPAERDYVMPPLPTGTVTLTDAFGGKHLVQVEIAATQVSRMRGMMWRTGLEDGKGMLFVFVSERPQSFWMRNTLIPLDMIFANAKGEVVGVVQKAEPQTLTARGVPTPSLYVLEVPGGWAERNNVRVGSKMDVRGLGRVTVEPP